MRHPLAGQARGEWSCGLDESVSGRSRPARQTCLAWRRHEVWGARVFVPGPFGALRTARTFLVVTGPERGVQESGPSLWRTLGLSLGRRGEAAPCLFSAACSSQRGAGSQTAKYPPPGDEGQVPRPGQEPGGAGAQSRPPLTWPCVSLDELLNHAPAPRPPAARTSVGPSVQQAAVWQGAARGPRSPAGPGTLQLVSHPPLGNFLFV